MKRFILAASMIAIFGACSKVEAPKTEEASKTGVEVVDARVRSPLGGADVTAGYVTIKNHDSAAVEIIGGSTDIAKTLELHTHEKGADGMMQMRQVERFVIAPNDSLVLEPGGKHLMLFTPKAGLKEGDKAQFTLNTKSGTPIEFDATIVTNPKKSDSDDSEEKDHEKSESEKPESGMKADEKKKMESHEGH